MLAARGAPRPDLNAMLAARGAPRPDLNAMLAARGAPKVESSDAENGSPDFKAMRLGLVAGRGIPFPGGRGGGIGGIGGLGGVGGGLKSKPKPPKQQPLGEGIPSNEEVVR
jgi:hypothetical protein